MRALHLFVVCAVLSSGCLTTRQKDVSGSGDDRLDDGSAKESAAPSGAATDERCGAEGKGSLVLYDARTAEVVSCAMVQLTRENADCAQRCRMFQGEGAQAAGSGGTACPDGTTCPAERLFNGRSNKAGQVSAPALGKEPLTAVVEGYALTAFDPTSAVANGPVEVELLPTRGFILKLLDQDGNYLTGVSAAFTQGVDVFAQLRSNDLANVFLASNPFGAGEPVTVSVEGFQPVEVKALSDLGADGHTLTLKKN